MFFRIKTSGDRRYLQIVENERDGSKTRQSVLATLGRIDELEASGKLDALLRSGTRFCETAVLISGLRDGTLETSATKRIGAVLVFERLWEQTGCRQVIANLLGQRRFEFPVERAIFSTVLHRLMISGSDRACERWLDAYRIDGAENLELHHLYRAMGWLGEALTDQDGATHSPRRTKDLIEEQLFARRRSLFSDLSMVLFDTTSFYFHGAGGESLGRHGKSKDHRPDLKQVVVGVVLDKDGRPICSESWPGNTTDVKALLPVIDRLRQRFGINRMCVCADRGMISAETLAELEARGIEYILGARERSDKEVREIVLADKKPMVPLAIPKANGKCTEIEVKEVIVGDWGPGSNPRRYVVCFNPQEAKRDAAAREAILHSLADKLDHGDKALVGNDGYRRFLATPRDGHFKIDPDRVAEDARFDGIYILRTNTKLNTLSIALAYRQLWRVEAIFRTAKSILETRPIFHQGDDTIAGHLFCSFLALVLRKELDERLAAAGYDPEWGDVVRDLDRVEEVTVEQNNKRFNLRAQAPGCAGLVCKAVGVSLPPLVQQLPAVMLRPKPKPKSASRLSLPPKRGATSRPSV
ncbi:MAG TPA: IS1634 family transposase [Anaerolineae bacterium]|nr:IS1634 family transposase [Anaerolineae bacterium]